LQIALAKASEFVADYDGMGANFSSPALRRVFFAALVVAAAVVVWQAGEIWLADYRLQSGIPDKMEKGAALLPGDADGWDRLGRFYLLSFYDPNIPLAIADFQKAAKVDPLSEDYWMDLASAYDASGDERAAQEAYEQARRVYPTSALVDWNYGNFLLREGDDEEGLAAIQRAVHGNPTILPLAISRVWHSSADVNELLDHVIPADQNSYFTALNFFASSQQVRPGLVVWQRLVALKDPLPLSRTFQFLEELIHEDDSDDALRVWNQAVAAAGQEQLAVTGDSLVSDGSFRTDFPNGGLGWRWQTELGTSIDFDPSTPAGQGRSIRLDFSGGTNTNVNEPMQYVALEPSHTYHFHAAMRTDQITTDSGMRFYISDPSQNGLNFQTENLTGTRPWTDVDLDVSTSPRTHFLLIQLLRNPSTFFDNKLSGTVWITDVSLVPAPSDAGQPRQ
jgi:tetratricopeptide (TPR) repeat protein